MDASLLVGLGALVLQTLVLGGGGLIFITRLQGKQTMDNELLKLRLSTLETNTIEIKAAVKVSADQTVRLNFLEKAYDDLRRGRGYLQREIDGKYSRSEKLAEGQSA